MPLIVALFLFFCAQAFAQQLECVDCVPTQAIQNNAVTPNKVMSSGQTDGACLRYQASGQTWQWGSCGQSWALRQNNNTLSSSVASVDYDIGDFDASCTSNNCSIAASAEMLMNNAGMIGASADFEPTVDFRTKTFLGPVASTAPPSTCTQGQVYFNTAGGIFNQWAYYCIATNTWRRMALPFISLTGGAFTTGSNALPASTTQQYFSPVAVNIAVTTTNGNADSPAPWTGRFYAMFVAVNTAPGGSVSRTFTLMIAGSNSAVACAITGTAQTCSYTSSTGVAVTAGQLLQMTVTASGGTPAATDATVHIVGLPDAL